MKCIRLQLLVMLYSGQKSSVLYKTESKILKIFQETKVKEFQRYNEKFVLCMRTLWNILSLGGSTQIFYRKKKDATDSVPVKSKPATNNLFQYNMDFPEIGLCLIIDLKPNNGTSPFQLQRKDKDLKTLKHTFETLGFTVQIETITTNDGITPCLYKAANRNHGKRSCFVCVLLVPEGNTKFNPSDTSALIGPFTGDKCRSLVGKPKLFFVLGNKEEDSETQLQCDGGLSGNMTAKIPVHADFLFVSFISSLVKPEDPGSWYIYTLCNMLQQYGHEVNLVTLLTEVHSLTAQHYLPSELENPPFIVSMLTKNVVFPKNIMYV